MKNKSITEYFDLTPFYYYYLSQNNDVLRKV